MSARSGLRVLELYCGLGGLAAALAGGELSGPGELSGHVVLAVDLKREALDVYGRNFDHPRRAALVESLGARELGALGADLWWASPPCQPFTRRGRGRDLDDPRAATFRALVERVAAVSPPYLALENVAPFADSAARDLLRRTLEGAGYRQVVEETRCPSELGMPNRRPRYYLLASRDGDLRPPAATPTHGRTLAELIAGEAHSTPADLALDPETARRYRHALHVVRLRDPDAVTSCFTSAYGRSPVRSGSYLETPSGPRYFSPAEVLRLLGFTASFRLPAARSSRSRRKLWRLAGNSLSIPAVRHLLSRIPGLSSG